MKTFMSTLALGALLSTTAVAGDFDNTTLGVNVISGPLDFSLDADENAVTGFEVGVTTLAHTLGSADAGVRFALGTELNDTMYARGEYNLGADLTTSLSAYGTMAVQVTTDTDLGNDQWALDPSVGLAYTITPMLSVYGEVGNTWDMSNDMADMGGYVEVGMPFAITSSVSLTPSISRGFNTADDATNARLEATFSF